MPSLTRRNVVAGAAGAALAAKVGAPAIAAADTRPNVLFIPIDDLNDWTGWLGGYPGVQTPNIDRLARLTTGFIRAYTPAPACQPARAAILFGIEPYRTGVYTNKTANWTSTFLTKRPSIIRWFKDAGYKTIGTGKTFHDGWRGPGYDEPKANDAGAWTRFEYLSELRDGGMDGPIEWGANGEPLSEMEDVGRAKWMVDNVLSKKQDRPFFASLGIRKPHLPWYVPDRFFKQYPLDEVKYPLGALDPANGTIDTNKDTKDDIGRAGRRMILQNFEDHEALLKSGSWKKAVRGYLAAVSLADHAVGILLTGLLSGPNAGNTIICCWSDHGWQLGEKLSWRKFTLWERATRVPLLIGGPGLRSNRTDVLISTIDLYPTLANLAIGEAPSGLDGVDFSPWLRKEAEAPRDHVISTWSLDIGASSDPDFDRHFSVRTADHRLIRYGSGERELYDHRVDPWEWRNIAKQADQRDLVASMAAKLDGIDPVPPVLLKSASAEAVD